MGNHALAGRPAPRELLVDVPTLISRYYSDLPDPSVVSQRVVFGTSGHRRSSLKGISSESRMRPDKSLGPRLHQQARI